MLRARVGRGCIRSCGLRVQGWDGAEASARRRRWRCRCMLTCDRVEEGTIEKDYIVWINKEVSNARAVGRPGGYA
jgi:hypothetical protein